MFEQPYPIATVRPPRCSTYPPQTLKVNIEGAGQYQPKKTTNRTIALRAPPPSLKDIPQATSVVVSAYLYPRPMGNKATQLQTCINRLHIRHSRICRPMCQWAH